MDLPLDQPDPNLSGQHAHSNHPYQHQTQPGPARSHHLTRFNACRSCRKRKLRCDAQRPTCGPCLRRLPTSSTSTSNPNPNPDSNDPHNPTQTGPGPTAGPGQAQCIYDPPIIPKRKRTVPTAPAGLGYAGDTHAHAQTSDILRAKEPEGMDVLREKIRTLELELQSLRIHTGVSGVTGSGSGPGSGSQSKSNSNSPPTDLNSQSHPNPNPNPNPVPLSQTGQGSSTTILPLGNNQAPYDSTGAQGTPGVQGRLEVQGQVESSLSVPQQQQPHYQQLERGQPGQPGSIVWSLTNARPPPIGFNYFQAKAFVLGEETTAQSAHHQLKSTGYAASLPPVDILHMLVRRYFNRGNYMAKIFDQGSFWYRLSLPPSHPEYPYLGTLHAICAAASHLTASRGIKRQTPRPLNVSELSSLVMEREVYDPYDTGSLAFREYHARMANEIISVSMAHTHPLYSVMEATIVLQYHWMHEALVAKAWIYPGMTYNLCSYLGLHERRPPSRAARMSPVEMREADLAFWIGFCNEKMACAMSSWPSSYREEDITAFLPTCAGANGRYLQPTQWLGTPDIYTNHPAHHCDSTIFFIKSQILLSRVHTFMRDSKKAQTEGLGISAQMYAFHRANIDSFLLSIPRFWRTIFKEDGVDFDMFLCLLGTYLAIMQLAELATLVEPPLPQAYDTGSSNAAFSILALAESLIGTSLDLRVLPMFVPFVFFQASRVLVGDLQRAIATSNSALFMRSDAGLSSIRIAMDIFGEEFSQMFSIVDGVRNQALADGRMTELAKSYEQVVNGQAKGGGVYARPDCSTDISRRN